MRIFSAFLLIVSAAIFTSAHAASVSPKRTYKIATQKAFKELVADMADSMQPTTFVEFQKKMTPDFLKDLNRAMYFNHATHYYYYFNNNQVQIKFKFADSALLLAAHRKPILRRKLTSDQKKALKIAEDCLKRSVKPTMSRMEIVAALHNEVGKLCEYDNSPPGQSCVRLLLHHKGDCGAYARTLYLLLSMADIPCHVIQGHNVNAGGPHCWNLVQMDSEHWYHVDSCKDDRFGENNPYKYFGLTDEQNRRFHVWDEISFPKTPNERLEPPPAERDQKKRANQTAL